MNQQIKNIKEINNNIYIYKSEILNDSDALKLEPQPKTKKEVLYIKFLHQKKRSIRSLSFIHKYYDGNFILEE